MCYRNSDYKHNAYDFVDAVIKSSNISADRVNVSDNFDGPEDRKFAIRSAFNIVSDG